MRISNNGCRRKAAICSDKDTVTNSTPVTAEEVKFVDTGIKLNVEAHILDPGYSNASQTGNKFIRREYTDKSRNSIPETEQSYAETKVLIKDNNTLIIGGLIRQEKVKNIWHTPILGSLPILKFFFHGEYYKRRKEELVIFLTPHIIQYDESEDRSRTRRKK